MTRLGELEREVMDHLWSSREPQTVRQVHEALAARRDLAYTTIMTVLQRLAKKNLVVQHRDDRAHRYAPTHGRDELVAGLMVDALDQASDSGSREAALVHFVERVGADEAAALRRALPNWKPSIGLARPLAIRAPAEGDLTVCPRWPSPSSRCSSSDRCRRCWPERRGRCVRHVPRSCSGSRSRWPPCCPRSAQASRSPADSSYPVPTAGPPRRSPVRSTRSAGRCGSSTSWSSR